MSIPDFRDQIPMWSKYLIYVGGTSNKFYECRIDLGDDGRFCVTKRWGRRPDFGGGQIKVETYGNLMIAQSVANTMLQSKVGGGYEYAERPDSANLKVDQDAQGEF